MEDGLDFFFFFLDNVGSCEHWKEPWLCSLWDPRVPSELTGTSGLLEG